MLEILIGFAAGYLSGHFGLGGGLITTPAIRLILEEPALIAVGTPLLVNIPSALVGAWSYSRRSLVSWSVAKPLAIFGIGGAVGGAAITRWIGGSEILLITAVIIFVMGLRFVAQPQSGDQAQPRELSNGWLSLVGLLIGLASGILGLGGGFLLVPFLHLWMRLDLKTTFGTSLAVVAAITMPAALVHFQLGHVDIRLGFLMAIGVMPGAYFGSRAAMRLSNRSLSMMFGFLLIGIAVYLSYFEITVLAS